MRPWPHPSTLAERLPLPRGAGLRFFRPEELEALPNWILDWYPAVAVGAESVFTDPTFLAARMAHEGRPQAPILGLCITVDQIPVGILTFERQDANATLHGRLGALAEGHRKGMLGFLGFLAFEQLAELIDAELMLVWVTLQTRGQQRFAARRGFQLFGIVPGFDRDRRDDGSSRRVTEALFGKLRVPLADVERPSIDQLEPSTAAMLDQIWPQTEHG